MEVHYVIKDSFKVLVFLELLDSVEDLLKVGAIHFKSLQKEIKVLLLSPKSERKAAFFYFDKRIFQSPMRGLESLVFC